MVALAPPGLTYAHRGAGCKAAVKRRFRSTEAEWQAQEGQKMSPKP
jgi:hypothetical protein